MKYAGMPWMLWVVFRPSFQKQLTQELGIAVQDAKDVTARAKEKYKDIIASLPEFEKEDSFKLNIVGCAMLGAFVLNMPRRPDVQQLTQYYEKSMMIPLMQYFCRMSAKNKFTEKDRQHMQRTAQLKAAQRNPYSWNMEYYPYPDGSGYEARFTACGICTLMKQLGLYDLTPALCQLDYAMTAAGGTSWFVRRYTLASGGPYCDCGYKKRRTGAQ